MALENPEALVALEDSLLRTGLSSTTIRSLIMAHNTIGNSALESDDYGKAISAGIYLYQIQAGNYIHTQKMVLLK